MSLRRLGMRSKFPLLVPGKEGARWKYAFNVNICSEQPERLIRFYADVVGLPPLPQVSPGAFRAGGAAFLVDGHSEVKGQAKEPQRVLLSFSVADVPAEQQRLEGDGVEFVRPATKEPWGGLVATFRDLDGNYCQLVAPKNS